MGHDKINTDNCETIRTKGTIMDNQVHTQIVSFIWSIADDCLRDVYVRGKYRDVILPMTVIRRLDAMLLKVL